MHELTLNFNTPDRHMVVPQPSKKLSLHGKVALHSRHMAHGSEGKGGAGDE